ncbi:MAG: transcriptional activator RfaH [Burkholderiaceae bacterium]|nr:transcriptional activator RfaH [Burkholderiaceae bacterium]
MTLADDSVHAGWYVVYTKPRQEPTACRNLLRQHFEVWLPLMGKWIRKGADRVCISEPMFPRYLFLRPTQREQSLASVRSTPGAVGLVRFGERSPTLRDEAVALLRELADQTRVPPGLPAPGSRVRVVAGPLAGLEALVAASASRRVEIFIGLLGRETRVSLSPDLVEPVPA